jgi:hypothetical protein
VSFRILNWPRGGSNGLAGPDPQAIQTKLATQLTHTAAASTDCSTAAVTSRHISHTQSLCADARLGVLQVLQSLMQRTGYQALEELLRDKGYSISKSAIHRYGQKIERRFAAIRASTEAAKLLTQGASDDTDTRSEALLALVQTQLFESIVDLQEAGDEGVSNEDRISLLSKVAKNIATLSRASVNQKKFRLEEQARIEQKARESLLAEQEQKLEELRGSDGMSEQMESSIRRILLGKE